METLKDKILREVEEQFGSTGVSAAIHVCSMLEEQSQDMNDCIDTIVEIGSLMDTELYEDGSFEKVCERMRRCDEYFDTDSFELDLDGTYRDLE